MNAWNIKNDPFDGEDSYVIEVTDEHGEEVMLIGYEELLGSIPRRHTLKLLKQRLEQKLDNPEDYKLAGDIFAMTERPSFSKKKKRPTALAVLPPNA